MRFGINSIINTDDRTNKILNENFECHRGRIWFKNTIKVGYGSKMPSRSDMIQKIIVPLFKVHSYKIRSDIYDSSGRIKENCLS